MTARDSSDRDAATQTADLASALTPVLVPILPAERPAKASTLYLEIALRLAQMIASGALQPGQRLPSVRDSAAQNNVSVTTVVQALATLEEHRLVQPRARSGYFVATASRAKAAALVRKIRREPELPKALPSAASASTFPCAVVAQKPLVSFAGYAPKDKDFFDTDRIRVALSRAARLRRDTLVEYTNSVGTLALRNAVALRAMHLGCALKAEDIVITSGCINAVGLCLQAVTQPGDMVAIESPTFYGFLDLLQSLNLKAIALPTDARSGVSLAALQLALETQPIKAVLLVPTLSNPLASVMPLTQKRALARMVAQYQVPLIEDVVFNDLLATDARRRAVKAYDTDGWVMTCGSFAKTVSPGIRLGWVDAGRWSKPVGTLKRVQGTATNAVLEHALADLLTQGNYESHLRRLCMLMKQRLGHARKLIQASFPGGTKVNDPPAGYTLWVELPLAVDTMLLFDVCKAQGITVGPGQLFCASHRYRNCLRLSFSGCWGTQEQDALTEVGRLACQLVYNAKAASESGVMELSRTDFMCRDEVSAYDLW
jgi:DNA-binding transcriptional MocR family regulator